MLKNMNELDISWFKDLASQGKTHKICKVGFKTKQEKLALQSHKIISIINFKSIQSQFHSFFPFKVTVS